jgi:hypothetical protein
MWNLLRNCRFFSTADKFLLKGNTFYRNQDPGGERHYLWGTSCRRLFGEKLAVNFIYDAKVVSGNHENCRFYDFIYTASRFIQNDLDILET